MARIDLNIVDRGIQGTDWIAEETGLTADHLDKVIEQKTDNSGALNSLPTPFARFFVAREAFRRAYEEHLNPKKEAGYAYSQLVSDILDVYEILFNIKYHKNNSWKNGETLELLEWNCADNLESMKKLMPILYNSIKDYYSTDIKEPKLYFLVYKEEGKDILLACSSPITGFVTPPDMDKSKIRRNGTDILVFAGSQFNNLSIRRKSGGEYFKSLCMFEDREQDFKNYMYNEIFSNEACDSRLKEIRSYIRSFKQDKDIRNDYKMKLTDVLTDQNNSLVVNGIHFKSCDDIDINSFFTDSIIRVPYRIARNKFTSVVYENDIKERDYDYLLPFKPEITSLFPNGIIDSKVHINRDTITVKLNYNGKEYKKEYGETPLGHGWGKIIDMQKSSLNFNIGLFPNILSYEEKENNYFKVLVLAADEDPEPPIFNIDKINLNFFKKVSNGYLRIRELDPETSNANYCVLPSVVRSSQKTEVMESGTKFYELYNSSFDMIELEALGGTGLIMPVWETSKANNETFTYAVDLGTSNSFMSRCKNDSDGKPDLSKSPELFTLQRPMVNYLHEVPNDDQISYSQMVEESIFEKAKNKIKTEFLPAIIDGTEYQFPIRTALCGIKDKRAQPRLFDNHNIAFFYEKLMANDDQDVFTDIKWEKDESKLRVFIQELLLIIKCDILQRDGDLDRTKLVWFRPLSFMGESKAIFENLWAKEPARILSVQPSQVNCYSESEAPYYYFKNKNIIADSDSVSVIDIGGGSTDFVYYQDNKPLMANSVHFGCDVLWGNGYEVFEDAKNNGIYTKYADTLRFRREDLNTLNACLKHVDAVKTKDIINFWLGNANYCDIMRNLSTDFKPVFVYHFTSIIFYMAYMYKDNGFIAPRTIIFSGNGSKYIDNFISSDKNILKQIINLIFSTVFGGEHNVNLELPSERKESTCYGGLYRDSKAPDVPEKIYHGDTSECYEKVSDINENMNTLRESLINKYGIMNTLYKSILDILKKERVIENTFDTDKYVAKASEDMATTFRTYYKTEVLEKYQEGVVLYDSVFFIPIVNTVYNLTKV